MKKKSEIHSLTIPLIAQKKWSPRP